MSLLPPTNGSAGDGHADPLADGAAGPAPSGDGDLPPVRPPTAGFLFQLFVIPALIVAVGGLIVLGFGTLAESRQSWEELVNELRQQSDRRRWRAAYSLAQLVQGDPSLANNGEFAGALCDVLFDELQQSAYQPEELEIRVYLVLALASCNDPETVVPGLVAALQQEHDFEVRRHALAGAAAFADRVALRESDEAAVHFDELVAEVDRASYDAEPRLRQVAAFTLGVLGGEEALDRLRVLLGDSDTDVTLNAAVGLARHGETDGYDVLYEYLRDEAEAIADEESRVESRGPRVES